VSAAGLPGCRAAHRDIPASTIFLSKGDGSHVEACPVARHFFRIRPLIAEPGSARMHLCDTGDAIVVLEVGSVHQSLADLGARHVALRRYL